MKNITVIVPVYGDWPSLQDCIESLKKHVADQHKVFFVNDCGPEVDQIELNIKKSINGVKNFHYYRNHTNLGFVQNCNNAVFNLDKSGNDVMLLNSDTVVTEGFIEEMTQVLYGDYEGVNVGVVSPRSNNATIATTPIKVMTRRLNFSPEESYKYFKINHAQKLPRYVITPVAHGFCMLIRRDLIDRYGLFDEVFGKGYGEEVDFCLRIKEKAGYVSALSNWSFVYHLEGRSFGIDNKKELIYESSKIIRQRYPSYSEKIKAYIEKAEINEEFSLVRRMYLIVRLAIKCSRIIQKLKVFIKKVKRRLIYLFKGP